MKTHRTTLPTLLIALLLACSLPAEALAGPAVSGDLRLREESNLDAPGRDDHHRGRLRARVAVKGGPADWVEVGARLRTGDPDDPNSPFVNMTDNLNSFPFAVDRAYGKFTPAKGLSIWGGKFGHPAKTREVVWDADVQPQGVATAWKFELGGAVKAVTPTVFYYLVNNPDPDNVASVGGAQVKAGFDFGAVSLDFATGVINFYDIDSLAGESGGNTMESPGEGDATTTTTSFANEFRLIDTLVDVGFEAGGLPITVSADVFVNTGADEDNTGFWAGVALGKLKAPGDWTLRYALSDVAADSVVAAMAQDDFRLSTGYQGHDIQLGVKLADGFSITGKAYLFKSKAGDVEGTEPDEGQMQTRARVDLDMRF